MHAGVRRMPAERARHAKRLGHVLAGPAPAGASTTIVTPQQSPTSTTAASSQTVPTSVSAQQSSSSALPSSSPAQSSPSTSSSATTSSASSVASSTSTQSPVVIPQSSSIISPSTAATSLPPTSLAPTPQANAAAATNSGLSGGAIAGIIAGAVIVGVALIVFFVRKTYLRRRERNRISWNGAPHMDEPNPLPDVSERPVSFSSAANTSQRGAPLSPFEAYGQPMYSTPVAPVAHMRPTLPTYATPTPPPATYNNPTPVAAYPTHFTPSAYHPGSAPAPVMARVATGAGISSTLPSARAQYAPVEAMVKCTFVPTLPDELSITTGERIFVVEQYDDGWNLCANGRGERGMVPHECLEHAPSDRPDIGWRNVQRTSSLNPDGRRV